MVCLHMDYQEKGYLMGNKRQANKRKRENIKLAKEKRDLQKAIIRTATDKGMKVISKKLRLAMQLKLTRLLSIYKSKYGEMKND